MKKILAVMFLISISLFAQSNIDSVKTSYIDEKIKECEQLYQQLQTAKAQLKAQLFDLYEAEKIINGKYQDLVNDKQKLQKEVKEK
jgi:peptidoglycan hydrolase CwlO-like protein